MDFIIILSFVAITAGGILSAFTARTPSRLTMWVVAYLVLVVGIVQLGLAYSWLALKLPTNTIVLAAFVFYNFGNVAVIIGTIKKGRSHWAKYLVRRGGILLAFSMLGLISNAYGVALSWTAVLFYTLTTVILVSMPVGLILATKHNDKKQ